jgi:hypothetical protein
MRRRRPRRWKLTLPMIEQMKFDDEPEFLTEFKRCMIDRLRHHQLSDAERHLLAQELEAFWFPTKTLKQARRDDAKMFRADLFDAGIRHIAAAEKISIADAKLKIVDLNKLQSTEALDQSIKRARRKAKGDKKIKKMSRSA